MFKAFISSTIMHLRLRFPAESLTILAMGNVFAAHAYDETAPRYGVAEIKVGSLASSTLYIFLISLLPLATL